MDNGIKTKIIEMLEEVKNDLTLSEKVNDSTDVINDIGLDSLQMINFVLTMEDEFGIEIDFEEFDFTTFNTISSICEFVSEQLQKSEA